MISSKKSNNPDMSKSWQPSSFEDDIYSTWENSGFFNPDHLILSSKAKPYTIVLPPPNITDRLHLGHACMLAIQDLLIRFKRMQGFKTLWLPGTDHASIATQNVVERKLLNEENKTRHDLGKEKFLEKVWDYVYKTQTEILSQTRKMGASLDWSRQAFTLDEKRAKAVRKMFVDMYREGIIYRGERIVNWCPRCQSTLADDEIEYEENQSRLYYFRYDSSFPFEIATTRPETKLGDTAVAVNPKDDRYRQFIGQTITADFLGQKLKLKIISDWKVDPKFGTGALGVTPAHSEVDWKMAEENKLDIIKVIDEDGKIRPGFGEFSSLPVLEARKLIVQKLESQGLLTKTEEITNNLSTCYRCGTPIEPLPSLQWFVDVDKKLKRLGDKSLKERALEAATSGTIKFTPKRFTRRYLTWMENLHDWCISRQIWFGHQIPVYYRGDEIHVSESEPEGEGWTRDPDTLDTWFSSGTWTFSTLGWPENYQDGQKLGDLARFHPTQMLETGHEIITLWVSRMIIMSIFALNEIPFEDVYLHGMVLDKHGKKMSKTKGNGIDPVDMIVKYGTDAVRLSLVIGTTPGNDTRFDETKTENHKNFINKLWNIARFIITTYDVTPSPSVHNIDKPHFDESKLTLFDHWILGKMDILINEVTQDLSKFRFSSAGEKLYSFTWDDLADWYLEVSKFEKDSQKKEILVFILTRLLRLLHPFTPFVTEKIWSHLFDTSKKENLLLVTPWPKSEKSAKNISNKDVGLIQDIIIAIRNARSLNKIDPSRKVKAVIYAGDQSDLITSQSHLLTGLKTGISELEVKPGSHKIENAVYVSVSGIEIFLLGGIDEAAEIKRLQKEIQALENLISSRQIRLQNQAFVSKAPAAIVTVEKEKLKEEQSQLQNLQDRLSKYQK